MTFPQLVALASPFGDQLQTGAFGRLQVDQPFALFDNYPTYGLDTREWSALTVTGGTVTNDLIAGLVALDTTTVSGAVARIVTDTYFRYQAGRGAFVSLTGYFRTFSATNQRTRLGLYEPFLNMGVGFEMLNGKMGVFRLTDDGGVSTQFSGDLASFVSIDDWNRISQASRSAFDPTKNHIYEVQFQWLGVGTVRYFIDRELVHEMVHANVIAGPYMRTATLPVCLEIVNTGTADTAGGFNWICASVVSQGGEEPPLRSYAGPLTAQTRTLATADGLQPLFSLRPKLLFNFGINRIIMMPQHVTVTNDEGIVDVFVYQAEPAATTGGSWVNVPQPSATQINTTGTGLTTTGAEIVERAVACSVTAGCPSLEIDLTSVFGRLGRKIRMKADSTLQPEFVVAAQKLGANTSNLRTTVRWGELT